MKINQIITENPKTRGEFHEAFGDENEVNFVPQNQVVMQTRDKKPVDTNMDDPSTATLVRNKQTKKLEVKNAGEQVNKAEFDPVEEDPKMIQREMEKQKKEQERVAKKAAFNAQKPTTQPTGQPGVS